MGSRGYDEEEYAGTCPCPLKLVTMAGNEMQVVVPISIYHNWEMLEDYLVELLSKSFGLDTFGCELTLLTADTPRPLNDPIHEELWDNEGFHLVIQKCLREVCSKEQIKREVYEDHPKAIWAPANDSGILPAKAFFSLARLRVATGFHTIERQAWRYCHTLTIVKLPRSVIAVENAAFQGCYALTTVAMPGCVTLGARLFAQCCALENVGVLTENPCRLVSGAIISPYAFEGCARLARIGLPPTRAITDMMSPSSSPAGIPIGRFHSSGIQLVQMPQGTTFIGHKAFAHCKQLVEVDLSRTQVEVVHMQVFAHCQPLAYVTLPTQLKEISAEAFEACGALCALALPQQLRYIGHRAFAGCNKLVCLTYRGTRTNRRRLHIADNAFEACNALTIPGEICYLSLHSSNCNQRNRSRRWRNRPEH